MNTKTQYAILGKIENVIRTAKAQKDSRPIERIIDELIALGCFPILGKTLLSEKETTDWKDTSYDKHARSREQQKERDYKSKQIHIVVDIPLL